jgi:hypothetical protein
MDEMDERFGDVWYKITGYIIASKKVSDSLTKVD